MKKQKNIEERKNKTQQQRIRYETPAIIFEGRITTRAGSGPLDNPDSVDPADLFG